MIPFGHCDIGEAERKNVMDVLDGGWLTHGKWCDIVEKRTGGVVVSSGTAALHLALLACGVGPGDEVIVPATTFVATGNAVLYCGAKPIVVDVDTDSWMLTPSMAAPWMTRRTKAIIPVHLYGARPESFMQLARDHRKRTGNKIYIVDDCAEGYVFDALGYVLDYPECDIAAYSFYASKIIGCGEGGLVASRDDELLDRVVHMRGHCMTGTRYNHDALGFNYRMTELSAAVLAAQIERSSEFIRRREHLLESYTQLLPSHVISQRRPRGGSPWAIGVRVLGLSDLGCPSKKLIVKMAKRGVECRPVFEPISRFEHIGGASSAIPRENAGNRWTAGVVLPLHTAMTNDDVNSVCEALQLCIEEMRTVV